MAAWKLNDRCPDCGSYLYGFEDCENPACNMPRELILEQYERRAEAAEEAHRRFVESEKAKEEWIRKEKESTANGWFWGFIIAILMLVSIGYCISTKTYNGH